MPYLYTGRLGKSDTTTSSRPSSLKLGSNVAKYGTWMDAVIKGPIVTPYTLNAVLYPNKTTLGRTADAVLIPASGVYLTASATTFGLVTVGVYQGAVGGGPIATQRLSRYNPTTGTSTLVATSTVPTFSAVDAAAPLGVSFYYVLQSYNATGTLIATTNSSSLLISDITDWLLMRSSGTLYVLSVSDSSATVVRQSEEFSPISSTYKVVQQGEVIGRRGQIELVVTDAGREVGYATLRDFASDLGQVYLKSPFGDVYAVDLGAMSIEMVPGGLKIGLPFIENATA